MRSSRGEKVRECVKKGEGVMLNFSYVHTDITPINLMLLNTAIFHSSNHHEEG